MDTSTYLLELAQKFQLTSFNGDVSALSSGICSSSGLSTSASSSSPDTESNEFSGIETSGVSDVLSPPTRRIGGRDAAAATSASPSSSSAAAAPAASSSSTLRPRSSSLGRRPRKSSRDDDLRVKYDALKKNFKAQTAELERITKELEVGRRNWSRERSEFDSRIRQLESSRSSLDAQVQRQQLEFQHAITSKQHELNTVQAALRTAQQALQEAHPDISQQLDTLKDELNDLQVSEAMYLEYKSIERPRQSLREFLCCAVYELVRSEKSQRESVVREMEGIRSRLIEKEEEAERNGRERDQIAKLKRMREAELQSELTHYETLNAKLHDELSKKTVSVNTLTTKGELYDALRARADKLEEEVHELGQKDAMQTASIRTLTTEAEQSSTRIQSLTQQIDLLNQDKMYLRKEVDRLTEVYRNTEKEKERLNNKIDQLKRQKEEMIDKLTKVREEHQQSYEEKLNAELARLQSRTNSDFESIRQNQREAFEREIAGLKESRATIQAEYETVRTNLENVREDYSVLQEEHRRLQSQLENERSESRTNLKLKSFELERLGLTYEETLSDLRKQKVENEVTNKKLQVIKSELLELQATSTKRITELEGEERYLKEKLSMYQQLEYELDMAILNAGGVDGGSRGSKSGEDEEKDAEGSPTGASFRGIHALLEGLGGNVPSSNKRRIKQSLLLAQQLVEKQKQIDVLTQEVDALKKRSRELDTQLSAANHALEFTSQPHNYLIKALQSKDAQLAESEANLQTKQQELERIQREYKATLQMKAAIEADMKKLLTSQTQIDQIKQALLNAATKQQQQPTNTAATATTDGAGNSLLGGMVDASHYYQLARALKENQPPPPHRPLQPQQYQQQQSRPHTPHAAIHDPTKQHRSLPGSTAATPSSSSRATHGGITSHEGVTMLEGSTSISRQTTGDATMDDQPRPLWFRKLTK